MAVVSSACDGEGENDDCYIEFGVFRFKPNEHHEIY